MKTAELTGAALDWAVAKCVYPDLVWGSSIGVHHASHQIVIPHLPEPKCYWNPSPDWAHDVPIIEREKISLNQDSDFPSTSWAAYWSQGGPIIEREGIGFFPSEREGKPRWGARMVNTYISYGPTPLIAAMRCYVASKMGDEIEIPKDLK